MLLIAPPSAPLTPAEQFGLDVLVDLSRVVVLADDERSASSEPGSSAVALRVAPPAGPPDGPSGGSSTRPSVDLDAGIDITDGVITVARSHLRAITDVAGGAAEQRSMAEDRHGRVPSTANPMVADGSERTPVVSAAGDRLRRAIVKAAGSRPARFLAPWPEGRRWCVAFTHDVDVVSAWPAFTGLRVAELARKGQLAVAARVVAAAGRLAFGDPVWEGVNGVLEVERHAGVTSTWFLLCGKPTAATFRAGDVTYRPESARSRRIMAEARRAGHEIGLHGSFATMTSADEFETQRGRLRGLSGGAPICGVRQHYLRMRPGLTQERMVRAGFAYDATYGFPDRNGFRLGVADVVPGWNDAAGRQSPLDEVPLIWMDRAQSKYQRIEDPRRWIDDAIALADASRAVEGLWVGLWHPNLTPALGFPGAPAAYGQLVATLAAADPFVAPLDDVVEWRALRRSVRARTTPDGRVDVVAPTTRVRELVIEDADGRPVQRVSRSDDAGGGGA